MFYDDLAGIKPYNIYINSENVNSVFKCRFPRIVIPYSYKYFAGEIIAGQMFADLPKIWEFAGQMFAD